MGINTKSQIAFALSLKKKRGKKLKLGRPPKPVFPASVVREYLRDLKKVARILKQITVERLMPDIEAILARAQLSRPTTANDSRLDSYVDDIDNTISNARIAFYRNLNEDEIKEMASKNMGRVNDFNKKQNDKMLKKVLGINVFLGEQWLKEQMDAYTKQNVALITSIPEQYFEKVEGIVTRGATAGALGKDIAQEINHQFDVSTNRAKLIARDQVAKFNSSLTELRQTEVGVEKYEWSTSQDERVRPSHAEKESKTFDWDSPPEDTGHPGHDINCRCEKPENIITMSGKIKKIYRRKYCGDFVKIKTKSGFFIEATPNHPVLTNLGWIPLCDVNEGTNLVCQSLIDTENGINPHPNLNPTTFAKAFDFALSLGCPIRSITDSDLQFHGDGRNGKVDVIFLEGELSDKFHSAIFKQNEQFILTLPDQRKGFLFCLRPYFVSIANLIISLLIRHLRPFEKFRLRLISSLNSCFSENSGNDNSFIRAAKMFCNSIFTHARKIHGNDLIDRHINEIPRPARLTLIPSCINSEIAEMFAKAICIDSKNFRNGSQRLPLFMKFDRVVEKTLSKFDVHVYNLETETGYYFSGGIASHNCVAIPIFDKSFTGEED